MAYIIIGKDKTSDKLLLSSEAKNATYGEGVPEDIGTQHCRIEFDGNNIRIKNLDINNYTFVNGQAVESKSITRKDKIELGQSHYSLPWQAIDSVVPPMADIKPLRMIWDEYESQNTKLQIDERRFNSIRSATGLITMVAIALSIMTGRQSAWYFVLYGTAILVSLLFTIKAYRDASKIPQMRNEQNRKFQREYICPNCGHFMGNQPYDILAQNQQCPYCRAKFIH